MGPFPAGLSKDNNSSSTKVGPEQGVKVGASSSQRNGHEHLGSNGTFGSFGVQDLMMGLEGSHGLEDFAPETLCRHLLCASSGPSSPITQLERDREESWMAVWPQLDLPANA